MYLDAHFGEFVRNGAFGNHPAPAKIRLLGGDETGEIRSGGVYHRNHGGTRLFGRTVINTIHVSQDNQRIGTEHRSDETGQFVVVGKHEFSY